MQLKQIMLTAFLLIKLWLSSFNLSAFSQSSLIEMLFWDQRVQSPEENMTLIKNYWRQFFSSSFVMKESPNFFSSGENTDRQTTPSLTIMIRSKHFDLFLWVERDLRWKLPKLHLKGPSTKQTIASDWQEAMI